MKINDFSVEVVPGLETADGYVKMRHGTQYSIRCRNHKDLHCDARVAVDGKEVGIFRILAYETLLLERPANDIGRFTFYAVDSQEARQIGGVAGENTNGLVQVTFTPERPRPVVKTPSWEINPPMPWTADSGHEVGAMTSSVDFSSQAKPMNRASFGEGLTGLSGESDQRFVTVAPLLLDYSQKTTISLRLVAGNDKEPRPLKSVTRANPIPPMVG